MGACFGFALLRRGKALEKAVFLLRIVSGGLRPDPHPGRSCRRRGLGAWGLCQITSIASNLKGIAKTLSRETLHKTGKM